MKIETLTRKIKSKYNLDWTLGASTLPYPHDPIEGVKKFLEADIDINRFEIAIAQPLDDQKKTAEELRRLGQENDLEYSVHTPFLYDDLAQPHKSVRKVYTDEGKNAIDLASEIDGNHVVFHPGRLFFRQTLPDISAFKPLRNSRKSYLESSLESLTKLSEYAKPRGVKILVENLPFGLCKSPDDVNYLLSRLDNADFLLDVGHANISGTLKELLALQPQFFHFSDNDGENDQHVQLGKGTVDLDLLLERMLHYDGDKTIIFELYSIDDVVKSLETFERHLKI